MKTNKIIILGLATAGYLYTEYKKLEIVYKQSKRLQSLQEDHLTLDFVYTDLLNKNRRLEKFLNKNSKPVEKQPLKNRKGQKKNLK